MRTLQEIEARLAEINTEITTRGAEMTADELTALETEVAALQEERSQLQAAAGTQEQRNRILAAVAAGQAVAGQGAPTVLRSFPAAGGSQETSDDKYATMQYRKAFMD